MFELEEMVARGIMTEDEMIAHQERLKALGLARFIIQTGKPENWMQFRGEQPDSPALPADGALRGDVPLSETERSEV